MIAWLIVGAYVAAWWTSGYWLTRWLLIAIERDKYDLNGGGIHTDARRWELSRPDAEDRIVAAVAGYSLSIFPFAGLLAFFVFAFIAGNRHDRAVRQIRSER